MFTDYTGPSDIPYKCDKCEDADKDVTCFQCAPKYQEKACNKPLELGTPFKCYSHTQQDGKYQKTENTCTPLKDKPLVCNQPADENTSPSDYTSTSGCGPCPTGTEPASCKSCTEELCNAALPVIARDLSVILAVVGVIHVLLN